MKYNLISLPEVDSQIKFDKSNSRALYSYFEATMQLTSKYRPTKLLDRVPPDFQKQVGEELDYRVE